MQDISLTSITKTNTELTDSHFGGNIVAKADPGSVSGGYTENGRVTDSFREAIDELGITELRYPAGQPDYVYEEGLLINGRLPDHVENFFDSIADRPGNVIMVVPTSESYTGPNDIEAFTKLLLETYGAKISAIEVGNEYWQFHGESEYGARADEAILAIDRASQEVGVDVSIMVQMANASAEHSEFHESDLGWKDKTIEANKAIISQLSEEALDAMDTVLEHVYLRDQNIIVGDETESTNMAHLDIQTWATDTGRDFDLAITEWNIRTTNIEQQGIKGGSALLHHFDNLLKLGATTLSGWSVQGNTKTDCAGSNSVIPDADTGVVSNSVAGAAFDLLSSSVVGMKRLELDTSGAEEGISTFGFADDNEIVVFVSSRSESPEALSFSLGDTVEYSQLTSATKVGYDKSEDSSDGVHWSGPIDRWVASEEILVDGQPYYLNEHDVRASVEDLRISNQENSDAFDVRLLPFEFVKLTYSLADPVGTLPGSNSGSPDGGHGFDEVAQHIYSINGQDTIVGGTGNDLISGGIDNDDLTGGEGSDTIRAGSGFDTISGGGGNDFLFGDFNADTFVFEDGHGQDTIEDFNSQNEHIDLSAVTSLGSFTELRSEMRQDGEGAIISTGSGNSILVRNLNISDLDENDFVF